METFPPPRNCATARIYIFMRGEGGGGSSLGQSVKLCGLLSREFDLFVRVRDY